MRKHNGTRGFFRWAIRLVILIVTVTMLFCCSTQVYAVTEAPYDGYYYDQWDEARPAPNGYKPVGSVDAVGLGVPEFGTVNDLSSDTAGNLYLMDSDRSVIYQMNCEMKSVKTVSVKKNGQPVLFGGAKGFTVSRIGDAVKLYIADTDHQRILVCDGDGNLLRTIGKPQTDLLSEEQQFLPIKVAVNADESLFILCQQMYDGAILLDSKDNFLGFFGSNKVEVNAGLLKDQFWKKILGEKLSEKFSRYVPKEYSNMIIDEKGFVYATTLVSENSNNQIRRLNWKSNNILSGESFGDSDNNWGKNKFIDIAAMGDGIFAALDSSRGRVFLYGEDGGAVTVFGGSGTQEGVFRTAVAVESIGNNLYVYDQSSKQITRFAPTDYGDTLLRATRLFLKSNYEEAQPLWQEILRQNNGYETAYISIGRYHMERGEYKKALSCFRECGSREDYSDAFEQVRSAHIRKWFPLYAVIFVALIVLVFFLLRGKGSYKNEYESDPVTFGQKFRYALFHPNKGTIPLVSTGRSMDLASATILLAAFLVSIFSYRFTGVIFNRNDPGKMNIVIMFVAIIGMFAVTVISNWLVTTMTDGKGKLLEIVGVMAFSLVPVLGAELCKIVISNVIVLNESMFLTLINVIGYGWGIALFVLGLAKIHEFSFCKNLLMLLLTLVAVCIILVLLLLCFSIEKQLEIFFISVYNEIKMIL